MSEQKAADFSDTKTFLVDVETLDTSSESGIIEIGIRSWESPENFEVIYVDWTQTSDENVNRDTLLFWFNEVSKGNTTPIKAAKLGVHSAKAIARYAEIINTSIQKHKKIKILTYTGMDENVLSGNLKMNLRFAMRNGKVDTAVAEIPFYLYYDIRSALLLLFGEERTPKIVKVAKETAARLLGHLHSTEVDTLWLGMLWYLLQAAIEAPPSFKNCEIENYKIYFEQYAKNVTPAE